MTAARHFYEFSRELSVASEIDRQDMMGNEVYMRFEIALQREPTLTRANMRGKLAAGIAEFASARISRQCAHATLASEDQYLPAFPMKKLVIPRGSCRRKVQSGFRVCS
jgi:hypothetical protein